MLITYILKRKQLKNKVLQQKKSTILSAPPRILYIHTQTKQKEWKSVTTQNREARIENRDSIRRNNRAELPNLAKIYIYFLRSLLYSKQLRKSFKNLLLLASLCLLTFTSLYGEGSVDFINYPGYRLFYNTSIDQQLKVYAGAGEFINVGASHLGVRGGFIQVYRPDGSLHSTFDGSDNLAIINNHIEELNGPNGGGTTQGEGYTPGSIEVSETEAGIWTIILDYPEHNFTDFANIENSAAWTRTDDQPDNRRVILAWDITISLDGAGNEGGVFQTGRVYSKEYVSMLNRNGVTTSPTFYVLSQDGYQYQVDFNQTDPFSFPLSANNMGVVFGNGKATYQSSRQTDLTISSDIGNWEATQKYLYPSQAQDTLNLINHKIFFNPPDPFMPSAALVTEIFGQNTHSTWLYREPEPVIFDAFDISRKFLVDCAQNRYILDSNYIHFESSHAGMLQVQIDVNNNNSFEDSIDVELSTFINAGTDSILWNGLDGFKNTISVENDTLWEIDLSFQAGEIHIFNQDVENDLGGLTLTLLNGENAPLTEFYYDHSTVGAGVSGGGTSGNALATDEPFTYQDGFGNEILFDYWAFAILEQHEIIADFKIANTVTDTIIDSDKDGFANEFDLDDDNDGIPDAIEVCKGDPNCPLLNLDPEGDEDGDCIVNYKDANEVNFEINCVDANADGICDYPPFWLDADEDNIPNHLDLDSDNDGITDLQEARHDAPDTNQDGIIDGDAADFIIDGFAVFLATGIGINYDLGDADQDSIFNFLDLDSDNDGIHDIQEGQFFSLDKNFDGRVDNTARTDVNPFGIPSAIPSPIPLALDSDIDSYYNAIDLDSDNDGIGDVIEGGNKFSIGGVIEGGSRDADQDGFIGTSKIVINRYGQPISDALEVRFTPFGPPQDTDMDGIRNFRDLDSDNDGIGDVIEGGNSDADRNGFIGKSALVFNNLGQVITDADGFIFEPNLSPLDSDGDGVDNLIDLDSDNDGIGDVIEGGNKDDDQDGFIGKEALIFTALGQVLADELGNNFLPNRTPLDTDGDGVFNVVDLDSDNDGIGDVIEGGNRDFDQDGFIGTSPLIFNSFGQAISDEEELFFTINELPLDSDGDGIFNLMDLDSDNDGIGDVIEGGSKIGDVIEGGSRDADQDGFIGSAEVVYNEFGQTITDAAGLLFDLNELPLDSDEDGIFNMIDLDSDNDGIGDVIEGGNTDADEDGFIGTAEVIYNEFGQTTTDAAGLIFELNQLPTDTDGDGIFNMQDLDSDNDGIGDVIEGGNKDADEDGFVGTARLVFNALGQAINDAEGLELQPNKSPLDNDKDGFFNFIDADSDNDGIGDVIEGGSKIGDVIEGGNRDADRDGFIGSSPLVFNRFGQPISDASNFSFDLNLLPLDSDSDEVFNFLDSDSDNDGIGDVIEGGNKDADTDGDGFIGTANVVYNNLGQVIESMSVIVPINLPPLDSDGDGIPNANDLDSDDDGINDVLEAGGMDENGDAFQDGTPTDAGTRGILLIINDKDEDGIPDFLDLDADGDGIGDLYENGGQDADKNFDGVADGIDSDGDGIKDAADILFDEFGDAELSELLDTDQDGIPDILDLDSDNDGRWDIVENGLANLDTDMDGIIDDLLDEDKDGIADTIDKLVNVFGGISPPDQDQDGIPNNLDLDSDNDGISDELEKSKALNNGDTDKDGIPDYLDLDSDNDGINDVLESGGTDEDGNGQADGIDENMDGIIDSPQDLVDTDEDGIPNHLDLDADNDGINDIVESGNEFLDSNNDGLADGNDQDGDGIVASVDDTPDSFGEVLDFIPNDEDADGTPDYLDEDSDNDGIFDIVETGNGELDSNQDGKIDEPFEDVDQDGIPSSLDGDDSVFGSTKQNDLDGDGIPDEADLDADGDGISDSLEIAAAINNGDTDLDGIPDHRDLDADNDGILDVLEIGGIDANGDGQLDGVDQDGDGLADNASPNILDTDQDGIPNYIDLDSDNDGSNDVAENGGEDPDNDGQVGLGPINVNGDGLPTTDVLGDLLIPITSITDTDEDNIPNYLDPDSDNDGIFDTQENNISDPDEDGIAGIATDSTNANGQILADNNPLATSISVDTDKDGIPNLLDQDSDNDGIPDQAEIEAALNNGDTDLDGIPDYLDLDSDNDGINDVQEIGLTDQNGDGQADGDDFNQDGLVDNPPSVLDTDNDGIPNQLDLDSDNDGILDIVENNNALADENGDGMADGADEDGDGIPASLDDNDTIFGEENDRPIQNTDGTDNPDFLDVDSDNDGINDIIISGNGNADLDNDGMADAPIIDEDQDGIPASLDGNDTVFGNFNAADIDADGIPNDIDIDDDNDGITDAIEVCQNDPDCPLSGIEPTGDEDADGIANFQDADDPAFVIDCPDVDNNGICDFLPIWLDADEDDIPNHQDLDADNDGISDLIEAGHQAVDDNLDGRIDGSPSDFGVDGFFVNLVNQEVLDSDQDSVFNFLDIDADNDGVYDVQEGQFSHLDEDNNGRIDNTARTAQVDDNGIANVLNQVLDFPKDTDQDIFYNAIDLDSDNDGIGDVIEGGSQLSTQGQGAGTAIFKVDVSGAIIQTVDGNNFTYESPEDKDEDGIFNLQDADSDNDGIGDVIEGGNSDPDKNGFVGNDPLTLNEMGQVLQDGNNTLFDPNETEVDTDEDGVFNYLDLDSDNDGIGDVIEGGNSDPDKNGFIGMDPLTINEMGQVLSDAMGETFDINVAPMDHDEDTYASYVDRDADNDGIGDVIEGGNSDPDKNGAVGSDPLETDFWGQVISDGMGLMYEPATTPMDSDEDNVFNFIDSDSDNDGIGDVIEGGNSDPDKNAYIGTNPVTFNIFGIPLSDAEGLTFIPFGEVPDTDKDSAYDYIDLDADNDGINDILEAGGIDLNGDAFQDGPVNQAGLTGILLDPTDSDGDGIPNFLDLDSDSDGVGDLVENGYSLLDSDGDGLIDIADLDLDGIQDLVDGLLEKFGDQDDPGLLFTDADALADFLDADSDGDGIWDISEGGWANLDQDNNGILDFLQDVDMDGIADILDQDTTAFGFIASPDMDGDGIPNLIDLDSDNDGISDSLEIAVAGNNGDTDGDGIPDHFDTDADNDGIFDVLEAGGIDANMDGQADGLDGNMDGILDTPLTLADADNDGIPNHIDEDSDNDTYSDELECPTPADCPDFDQDNLPDYLDEDCTQLSIPQVELVIQDDMLCEGNSTVLMAINQQSSPFPVSYTWEGSNRILVEETTSQADTFTLNLNDVDKSFEGYYYFSLTSLQGTCTTQQDSVFISVRSPEDFKPTIRFEADTVCPNSAALLMVEETENDLIDYYNWYLVQNGNRIQLLDSTRTGTFQIANVGATTLGDYQAEAVSLQCGTSFSNTIPLVIIGESTTIVAQNNSTPGEPICIGASVSFSVNNIPDATYQWIGPNGTITNERTFSIDAAQANDEGVYFVEVAVENCFQTTSNAISLLVDPTLNPPILGELDSICLGSEFSLMVQNPIPDTEYEWYRGDDTFIARTSTNSLVVTDRMQASDAGPYYVTAFSEDCQSPPSQEIQIYAIDTFEIEQAIAGIDQTLCNQTTVNLAANTPQQNIGRWTTLAGEIISNNSSFQAPLQSGDNQFVWTIRHPQCEVLSSSDTILISNQAVPTTIAFAGTNQTLCLEETANLAARNIPENIQGNWTNLTTALIENPSIANTNISNLAQGDNEFIWSLSTDLCPNFSQDTVIITRSTPPNETANVGDNQILCGNPNTVITANNPSQSSGQWISSNSNILIDNPTATNTNISNLAQGDNQLIWSLSTDVCPNFSQDTLIITLSTPPGESANVGDNQIICNNTSALVNANLPSQSSGEWIPLNTASIENPNAASTTISNLELGDNQFIWSLSTNLCPNYSQDTLLITRQAPPAEIANLGADQVLCGTSNTLLVATPPNFSTGQWINLSSASIDNPNAASTTISNLAQGENSFIWSLSTDICPNFSQDTLIITLSTPPGESANVGDNQIICSNTSTLVNANLPNQSTGQWINLSSASIDNPNAANINISNLALGENQFIWSLSTDVCPNYSQDTLLITRQVPPTEMASLGADQIICGSNSTVLSANPPNFSTGQWIHNRTAIIENPNAASTTISNLPLGDNQFIWSLSSDLCPNFSQDTIIITNNNPPNEIARVGNDQVLCNTTITSLEAIPPSQSTGRWINTSNAIIENPNTASTSISNLKEGTTRLIWSLSTDGCPDFNQDTLTILLRTPPNEIALAGNDQSICQGTEADLQATSPQQSMGTWTSLQANQIDNNQNPQTNIRNLQEGDNQFIWSLSTDICPNFSQDTVIITKTTPPNEVAQVDLVESVVCGANATLLTANSPSQSIGQWTTNNGALIENPQAAISEARNLSTGLNTFIWSLSTEQCPNFSQDTLQITQINLPAIIANAGNDQEVCEKESVQLNALNTNVSGTWTALAAGNLSSPQINNPNVDNLAIGENRFVWSLSTEQCPDFSQDTVLISRIMPPQETAFAGIDTALCLDNALNLNAQSPTLGTGQWQSSTNVLFNNPTSANTLLRNIPEGITQLTWALSYRGCLNYDSDTVEITKMSPPLEIAEAGMDQRFCTVEEIQLAARSNSALSSGQWSNTAGANFTNADKAETMATNLIAGNTYNFIWSLSTEFCPNFSQDSIQVVIDAIPNTSAIIAKDDFESTPSPTMPTMEFVLCDPQSLLLTANLPENSSGQWQSSNQLKLEQLSDGQAVISQIEDQELQFIWSLSQNSCINYSSDTLNLEIIRADGLQAAPDSYETFFNETIENIDLVNNDLIPDDMSWTFNIVEAPQGTVIEKGDGFIDYIPRLNFFGRDQLIYELCHDACPELCDTAIVYFPVKGTARDNSCFVTNTLTPNGDGLNDLLVIPCLAEFPDHQLSIFNRWGDEVFRASPYQNNWDATYKHSPLPPGTYFYFIALTDDPQEQLSGYFTIVR